MSSTHKWIAGRVAAIVVSAVLGYTLGHRETARSGEASASKNESAQGERKVLYWHDPMKPDVKFDKPGKSPFMDMDLQPVYADEAPGGGVRISSAVTQSLGVRSVEVKLGVFDQRVDAVGTVEEGLAMLQRATEQCPDFAENHLAYAKALVKDEQYAEARAEDPIRLVFRKLIQGQRRSANEVPREPQDRIPCAAHVAFMELAPGHCAPRDRAERDDRIDLGALTKNAERVSIGEHKLVCGELRVLDRRRHVEQHVTLDVDVPGDGEVHSHGNVGVCARLQLLGAQR